MHKKKIIFAALIALPIVLVIIAIFARPVGEKIDVDRSGKSNNGLSVPQVLTKSFNEKNSRYLISVEYPELNGSQDIGIQDKVNADIKTGVYEQIAGFHSENSVVASSSDPEFASSLESTFSVSLVTPKLFSASMTYADYAAGAAHPNSYVLTLNYNLKTGDPLDLDQILRDLNPSPGYLGRLGQYIRQDLIRQFGDDPESLEAIDFGAGPTLENYRRFVLDREGLTILFDPYQVAAYAAGTPKVNIPYEDLKKSVLKPTATSTIWWLE